MVQQLKARLLYGLDRGRANRLEDLPQRRMFRDLDTFQRALTETEAPESTFWEREEQRDEGAESQQTTEAKVEGTFKAFFGGAELSRSSQHAMQRSFHKHELGVCLQRYNIAHRLGAADLQEHLDEDFRGDLESFQQRPSHDRAVELVRMYGSDYISGLSAGGRLSLFTEHSRFGTEQRTSLLTKGKAGLRRFAEASASRDRSKAARTAEEMRDLSMKVSGGRHHGAVLFGGSVADWADSVEAGNSVLLSLDVAPVTQLLPDGPAKQCLESAREHHLRRSQLSSLQAAYNLFLTRGKEVAGLICTYYLKREGDPDCLASMFACHGCDARKDTSHINSLKLWLEQSINEIPDSAAGITEVMARDPAKEGRLSQLIETLQTAAGALSKLPIPLNGGATYETPSFCAHIANAQSLIKRAQAEIDAFVLDAQDFFAKLGKFASHIPQWILQGNYHTVQNQVMVLGPSNHGKGTVVNLLLGTQPGTPGAPDVSMHETVDSVKTYQTGQLLIHDPPGAGTRNFPFDYAYVLSMGLVYMRRVALLREVGQADTNEMFRQLVDVLQSRGSGFCIVLTKCDMLFLPGRGLEELVAEKRRTAEGTVPEGTPVFCISARPEHQHAGWNDVETFRSWMLTGNLQ